MFKHHSGLWLSSVLAFISIGCGGTTGTGDDAGVFDAGTACTFGSCGDKGYCDTTGFCAMKGCADTNTQPDVCSYGQYCGGTTPSCYDVEGTCASPAVTWNPQTSTGPVIYYVEKTTSDSTWCSGGAAAADVSVYVYLYNKGGTFAATGATLPLHSLYYVRADGSVLDVADTSGDGTTTTTDKMFRPAAGYVVSADGKELRLMLNFCGVTGTSLVAGFYYTGGNEYCASFTK